MNLKLKLIIGAIIAAIVIALGITIDLQHKRIVNLNKDLIVATTNIKAYEYENSELQNKAIQFEYTIDQLNYSKDSLIQRINQIRSQLKIKDKTIIELQYLLSENQKKDTLLLKDTIFVKDFVLDTLVQDDWSKFALHAEYPNYIDVDYGFLNETAVVFHESKVTVDPPKKCWLFRLFQKKHIVLEIDVLQENPYCTNRENKFVKIIK